MAQLQGRFPHVLKLTRSQGLSFIYQFQALKHRLPTPRWYDQHFTHAQSDIIQAVADIYSRFELIGIV